MYKTNPYPNSTWDPSKRAYTSSAWIMTACLLFNNLQSHPLTYFKWLATFGQLQTIVAPDKHKSGLLVKLNGYSEYN